MKRITVILFLNLTAICFAQEKSPVYSIVEEIHDKEWYETQWELWQKEAKEGTKSPNAWYNYYAASRALLNLTEGEEREKYAENGKEISEEFLKLHPNTFEANYVAMWSSGLRNKQMGYLWKAYDINPKDPRLFDDLLIHYEIEQEEAKRSEMAKKMVSENYLAHGILNWGYNLLSELEDNAIVISAGDNDTYALWLNMYGLGHREDVTVLNIHMLFLPDYRERYFSKLGIEDISDEDMSMSDMIAHVMQNDQGIPVHIATTAYQCIENGTIDSNLYLTGLTYLYCENQIDNFSRIRRNFEQRFALDYLKVKFTSHRMDKIAKSFDYTYIAAMIKLYHMYETAGEKAKQDALGELIEIVSIDAPMAEEIQKIIH